VIHGWDRLCEETDELGAGVGFRRADLAPAAGEAELPGGAQVWRSSFATILLVPVAASGDHFLASARDAAAAWMREHLEDEEGRGNLLDGYLLLALPEPPPQDSSVVGETEQDPYTCRKHVLWAAGEDGSWRPRLLCVTTLGLPEAVSPPALVAGMALPAPAAYALELWERFGSAARVAEEIHAAAAHAAQEEIAAHAG
jgi:hypothetical protein